MLLALAEVYEWIERLGAASLGTAFGWVMGYWVQNLLKKKLDYDDEVAKYLMAGGYFFIGLMFYEVLVVIGVVTMVIIIGVAISIKSHEKIMETERADDIERVNHGVPLRLEKSQDWVARGGDRPRLPNNGIEGPVEADFVQRRPR